MVCNKNGYFALKISQAKPNNKSMFELDKWQEIGNSLWQHKLRTFLTSVGISWGIFMLIFLLGAGKGLENGTMQNFGSMNKNTMWVWGERTTLPYKGLPPGRWVPIKTGDYLAVKYQVKGVDLISPKSGLWSQVVIRRNGKTASYDVNGVNSDYNKIIETEILEGRKINPNDIKEKRKVIYIGKSVKEKFLKDEDPIGKIIEISGAFFKIIGTFKSNQIGREAKDEEETIYMPYTALEQTFNKRGYIDNLIVTVKDGYDSKDVEKEISLTIGKRNNVSPDDNDAIGTWSLQEQFQTFSGLFLGIKSFIWMVGLGTILIGIISISNIMLIIVKERTKEIGLRKALGASPLSVVGLILQESIVLTSVSGFIGLISGVFVIDRMGRFMDSFGAKNEYFANPEVDLFVAITALIILIFAGTIAGLIPAIHAAKINPIDALRAE